MLDAFPAKIFMMPVDRWVYSICECPHDQLPGHGRLQRERDVEKMPKFSVPKMRGQQRQNFRTRSFFCVDAMYFLPIAYNPWLQ
jgi:hypothetical protein